MQNKSCFAYNYTMNLFIIKYLFPLIFDGEKTSRELAVHIGSPLYNASRATGMLQRLGLIRHPDKRARSWEIVPSNQLNLLLEKLLFVSKNNKEIKNLLQQPSIIKIGSTFHRIKGEQIISSIIESTGLSRLSVLNTLNKLADYELLRKGTGKLNKYYLPRSTLSQLFFESCYGIKNLFTNHKQRKSSPQQIIKQLTRDKSVLILVHYGSSSRGKSDRLSDIDLLAVTRDKISRGDILARYSSKGIDLSVYSKNGFLQLLKSHPDFVSNISMARVLKGKDILQAVIH